MWDIHINRNSTIGQDSTIRKIEQSFRGVLWVGDPGNFHDSFFVKKYYVNLKLFLLIFKKLSYKRHKPPKNDWHRKQQKKGTEKRERSQGCKTLDSSESRDLRPECPYNIRGATQDPRPEIQKLRPETQDPKSWTKFLRQTLVFMWNSTLREKLIFFFSSFLLLLTKF